MGMPAAAHRRHLVDDLLCSVDPHNLPATQLLMMDMALSTKHNVNINTNFDSARPWKICRESGSVLPMKCKFCPGELGQRSPAFELSSDHVQCVLTDEAWVLVRRPVEWDVLDRVLHRQKTVAWLLNADVPSSLCAEIIISKQKKLLVKKAGGASDPSKLGKSCDGRGTFLRPRKDFDLSPLGYDQCGCRLTDKSGRFEGFIKKVSLFGPWYTS